MAFNGENAIGQVDPTTPKVNYFPIPHEDTRIRRLDFGSDGTICYVISSRGKIGHLDPNTGEEREWDSPSGPKSHPYAIAVINNLFGRTSRGNGRIPWCHSTQPQKPFKVGQFPRASASSVMCG